MSNDVKFVLSDAQRDAMVLLNETDATKFINAAVTSKLTQTLVYNRKKAEETAWEDYQRMEGYLKSFGQKMPQSFGEYKINLLATFQNALDELGYKPNKKKNADGSDSDENAE